MVHKRSEEAILRRSRASAFRDRELAETISLQMKTRIINDEPGFKGEIIDIDPGDVLSDALGRGILQQPPLPENALRIFCAQNGRSYVIPAFRR